MNHSYEIQIAQAYQSHGLGTHMMEVYEGIGKRTNMKKAMLTVFKENQNAIKFYERRG